MSVDARLGTEVAGYRIERLLGRGGMGAVYLAEDVHLGRKVALKLLAPELAHDERFRERFLRESRLAASLDHSSIVPIFQAGESEGSLFIAMRNVEGSDLRRLLAEGPLEPASALSILGQVASALDTAHRRGLVHRDVKPGNVLIDEDGHAYLTDFGLTKQASSQSGLTQTGQLVGTIDYVAPEQVEGREVTGRADVYSLACVLYECLTGKRPYDRETEVAVLWAHVHEKPPPTGDADVDAVLARGMAKRAEDRYPTAAELVADARRVLGISSGELVRPLRLRRRRRSVLALVAVLALAAIASSAVVLATRGGESGLSSVAPDSVGVIDPKTNRIVAQIPVGGTPTRVSAGVSGAWVGDVQGETLLRIDPQHFTVVKTIGLGFTPSDVAAGPRDVWVGDPQHGVVHRVDPSANVVVQTTRVRTVRGQTLTDQVTPSVLATGADSAWANSGLTRIARLSAGSVVATQIDSGDYTAESLAFGMGSLWAGDLGSAVVSRIDPRRNAVAGTIQVGTATSEEAPLIVSLAAGGGAVWALGIPPEAPNSSYAGDVDYSKPAILFRIDPRVGGVVASGPLGRQAEPAVGGLAYFSSRTFRHVIAVGEGAVWVANTAERTLVRIDPKTNRAVTTIPLGGTPTHVSTGAGYVWVSVR